MPGRVAHLGVAVDLGRLGDQLDIEQVVIFVEAKQGDQTRVKDPEVFGGQVKTLGVGAPEVADVLPHSFVLLGMGEEVALSLRRRAVHDANTPDRRTPSRFFQHGHTPRAVQVPCGTLTSQELRIGVGGFVGGVPGPGLQSPRGVVEVAEEPGEGVEVDDPSVRVTAFGPKSTSTPRGTTIAVSPSERCWS